MGRLSGLIENARYLYKEEGLSAVARQTRHHALLLLRSQKDTHDRLNDFLDVLFINGCSFSVPHPIRYRVDHQCEQLNGMGVAAASVNVWELDLDMVRTARTFVIFRCPYNETVGEFISLAKSLNKKVLFDIDDLVIDTKYTDQIAFLDTMDPGERTGYDAGVNAMQKTMLMCDGAVTTTTALARELETYLPLVYVNRNVASEEMIHLSDRAVYERDVLPDVIADQVASRDKRRYKKACDTRKVHEAEGVSIGYFSGSITHNEDFEMVLPVLIELMETHASLRLHVVGELDLPSQLEPLRDRVEKHPFLPWERLPKLISQIDINIVPLKDTLFNRAKSENKWVEASLVKVPTVASDVGALSEVVENEVTGLLCSTIEDWRRNLSRLIEDAGERTRLGSAAYDVCRNSKTTLSSGKSLAEFIRKVQTPNIAMVMPSLDISGGNLVTLKHASVLAQHGYDVMVLDGFGTENWVDAYGCKLPVLNRRVLPGKIDECQFRGRFDKAVATFWQTFSFVRQYQRITERFYLVQGYETDFYKPLDSLRVLANATYGNDLGAHYVTISPWCQSWLLECFGKKAAFAPNGIDLNAFKFSERDFSGKIRILIEGDCGSEYKNVDESFRIVDRLDPGKYEIWYLSYKGEPKPFYKVDKLLTNIPHTQVGEVYSQCHILLKTSILESFSYPPLEMMATGGCAVVLRNQGNAEYLEDGVNCLAFSQGEEERAALLIEQICDDENLRARLLRGGLDTAKARSWDLLEGKILSLYE